LRYDGVSNATKHVAGDVEFLAFLATVGWQMSRVGRRNDDGTVTHAGWPYVSMDQYLAMRELPVDGSMPAAAWITSAVPPRGRCYVFEKLAQVGPEDAGRAWVVYEDGYAVETVQHALERLHIEKALEPVTQSGRGLSAMLSAMFGIIAEYGGPYGGAINQKHGQVPGEAPQLSESAGSDRGKP
jgi:hypothetical protein